MSNEMFNKIMEARCKIKLLPKSTMLERKNIIRAKYIDKEFIQLNSSNSIELYNEIESAIDSHCLEDLLQCFVECSHIGVDITDPLPSSDFSESSLHHAISQEKGGSLHIIDFLVQNSSSLDKKTKEGNTALHYCVIQNQPETLRLLLRSGANPDIENNNGKTPLNIAHERGYQLCGDLLLHSLSHKKRMFENVNIDWNLSLDDGSTDFSDEETLDENSRTYTRTPQKIKVGPNTPYNYNFTTEHDTSPDNNNSQECSSDWSCFNTSDSGYSPSSYRNSGMPPPPPPQSRKPSFFSGSNIATHLVGSLKKGKLVSNIGFHSYNTLPSSTNFRQEIKSASPNLSLPPVQKQSPSSDSGNDGSRSNSPVTYDSDGGKLLTGSTSSPSRTHYRDKISTMSLIKGQSTESLESLSDEPLTKFGVDCKSQDTQVQQIPDLHQYKRCRALYDCEADNEDELSFDEGNIIVIISEETEDDNWMDGILERDPTKRGLFPVSFVHILSD